MPKELIIEKEVQDKFPDLINLIKLSKTMNFEEKQYWINVLLIMSEEQIDNLRNILNNEQEELKKINESNKENNSQAIKKTLNNFDEKKYSVYKEKIHELEEKEEEKEAVEEKSLLSEIENL